MNPAELVPRLLVNRTLIERQGVVRDQATRLALVPTLVDVPLPHSVALAVVVGRNAVPPPVEGPIPGRPDHGEVPDREQAEVPSLTDEGVEEAKVHALQMGFRVAVEDDPNGPAGRVTEQDPPGHKRVPAGSLLILRVGTRAEQPTAAARPPRK